MLSITGFIKKNSIVGDIGTDHGYLPIYLYRNKIAKKVIATDVSESSLKKAEFAVGEIGIENFIETRLGNGLEVIKPFEIDTLVVAGMGGKLITDILESNLETRDSITSFIFQPNVGSRDLREYLVANNFEIIDEDIAIEKDKFYEIIYAEKGKTYISQDIYYEIGEKLVEKKDKKLVRYLNFKLDKLENILQEIKDKDFLSIVERQREINEEIINIKKVLDKIES